MIILPNTADTGPKPRKKWRGHELPLYCTELTNPNIVTLSLILYIVSINPTLTVLGMAMAMELIDLLGSHGEEIRATYFNLVLNWFYDLIEVGKVYLISRGSMKLAQK